ncbi:MULTISPECIES: phage major capsid protein [Methylosinus]|uniref:Phage major capsid protein n=1 Tax=Methylosinus trichosporium (strain ATCC 35070 / NCIMB 11131 / UNIQEM 75 / OB3b) TaxID=595536 RepID=A0A2D2CY87_METT3|nr:MULTISPECIES: phage major capsid protein [Methylosinus]ATQ67712.1 phage major capsid protein [Methylosinus trichosporium OB3b]OBS51179.1 major capsid protein [Methylosinus sp. 3S-1]
MPNLIELKESRAGKLAEMSTLTSAELNEESRTRFDALDKEVRTLDGDILRAEKFAEYERRYAPGKIIASPDRGEREYADLVGKFELRQAVSYLDEGRALTGATAEVVTELRNRGGYRGVPIPWGVLEKRSGETVGSGVPNPVRTMPIIDRLFAEAAAVRMGAEIVQIDSGAVEYPVTTSSVAAAWASSETGNVGGPTAYATTDRPLAPNSTLGIQAKITRKAQKQSGDALEQAVRRDLNGAIGEAMDRAVFLGAGASGEPAGVLVGSYGITSTAIDAAASYAAFSEAVMRFLIANAAAGPGDVKALIRPEVWNKLDNTLASDAGPKWEFDRMRENFGAIVMSGNALAAPTGSPATTKALLTTSAGGVPPIFVGLWGAIDLIRDPYSDAASGGLRLTALATMDVTVSRPSQLQILTGIQ